KVVEEVLRPFARGDFAASINHLRSALDGLPGIFGVPAVVRDNLDAASLRKLLQLEPRVSDENRSGAIFSLIDQDRLGQAFEAALRRRLSQTDGSTIEAVVEELLIVLDAISDEQHRAVVTDDDFKIALQLAEARAVEAG